MRKNKLIAAIIFGLSFTTSSICFESISFHVYAASAYEHSNTYTATGSFMMGDNDSPKQALNEARKDALRQISEQGGIYVESYSKTQGLVLTSDEVQTISSSILHVIREYDSRVDIDERGHLVAHTTVTATVDPSGFNLKDLASKYNTINMVGSEMKNQGNYELINKEIDADTFKRIADADDVNAQIIKEAARQIALGKYARAESLLDSLPPEVVHTELDNPRVYLLGVSLFKQNRYTSAERYFYILTNQKGKSRAGEYYEPALLYEGICMYVMGRYHYAYNYIQQAWESSSKDDDYMRRWYMKSYKKFAGLDDGEE